MNRVRSRSARVTAGMSWWLVLRAFGVLFFVQNLLAAAFQNPYGKIPTNSTPGDQMFAEYFRIESEKLASNNLSGIRTVEDWDARKTTLRRQLFEMLGLDPLPARTDLKATVTGVLEHPEFTVEKLHFQSIPGLYVTGDLYVPKNREKPLPAILYVCGHTPVKTNGVSYGCKVAYQHHGIWFARNGYVCLVLDTVQLGEIEGIHHGTYREGLWWWNSRGYTPAGVEAWNCIRALDYLETRPEVDRTKFGVTGRSGGGAYSWWVAALDERIKVACPVAGITDLENHVVDGTVEGHCDCMFMVNTYRWDYPEVAELVAPRPLLICNTDKDTIFPLDGVVRVYEKVREVYDLCHASDHLGLVITEGPHRDSQELQVPVFRWFNRFLKNQSPLIEKAAVPLFTGQQLKVFDKLPSDELTSKCHESFTHVATDTNPLDARSALDELRRRTFGGWPAVNSPAEPRALHSAERRGMQFAVYEFESQPTVKLRFYVLRDATSGCKNLSLEIGDEGAWERHLKLMSIGFGDLLKEECGVTKLGPNNPVSAADDKEFDQWIDGIRHSGSAKIIFEPRGLGFSRLTDDKTYLTQVRRRFMLLGQTLASMQTWDLRRAVQAARQLDGFGTLPLEVSADTAFTEVAAFAALFEPQISSLHLANEPRSDKAAPDFLNWSRIVTLQQLLTLARGKSQVQIDRTIPN